MTLEVFSDIVVPLFVGGVAGLLATRLEERRLRKEFQLQDSAESAVVALLSHGRWPLRSFRVIRHHMGGFSDKELRQLLVRSGAVRFMSKSGHELWGLLSRNQDRMGTTRIDEDPYNFLQGNVFDDGSGDG